MEVREVTGTDLRLSVLGLGTWPFGGDGWAGSWGPQRAEDSAAALRTAVELGVNWIDTAPAYGLGRSEELVGEITAALGVELLVATKCGERIHAGGTVRSGAPEGVAADCEASLRRLRRDVIDLYQLHHPPPDVPIEETWLAMRELVRTGKVRYLGLCNCSVDEVRRCHTIFPVASYQGPYSPLRRRMEQEVLPFCREAGISVLPFGALGHGFLARRRTRAQFAAGDWRAAPRWVEEFDRGQRIVTALAELAGDGIPVGSLTCRWLADRPGVVAVPVGARSGQQARQTFGGPDVTRLMERATAIIDRAG